jgi:hypothetical protein
MKVRGGESQRSNMCFSLGYSEKVPNATGKPSYLKPNSQTLQKRGRGVECSLPHRKKRTYLKPNSDSMQKPIGGRSKRVPAEKQGRGGGSKNDRVLSEVKFCYLHKNKPKNIHNKPTSRKK